MKFFKNNNKKLSGRKQPDANLLNRIHKSLLEAIEIHKIHHKKGLTIDELAKTLDTNREYLSQIINKHFDRFNSFINNCRTKDTIEIISDKNNPKNNFSLEIIAGEVVFKSLSVFIASFKKETGLTPSKFRESKRYETIE